ncbi:hypothetical protein HGRIS_008183 [Hohenbuehelia grisea]|uniref:Deacetylase sirtuin-type domain-containing protein n=1 Tax=Hohenbuehelia grisea TaxID=104357 RepID=A0ABR3J7L5_9AGAR
MATTLHLADISHDAQTRRGLLDLSLSVVKSKKIVVVTGAGISCSSGIPDFRSSDGLYALVKQQYPDIVLKGRDLFDASLFRDQTSTAVFYTFISQLKQTIDTSSPTPTHRFIKTLDTKKKLLRSYTQNIDGLEERAGLLSSSSQEAKSTGKGKSKLRVRDVRNVQLHGDIHRVRCIACSAEYPCSAEHLRLFDSGTPPDCPDCTQRSEARKARSARPTRVGTLRPAIVLYDEPHPLGDDIGTIQASDVSRKPDMLIIMGTSLKVHGLKKLVKDFAKTVHSHASSASTSTAKQWTGKVIFINKTPPGSEWAGIIDYHVAGDTDSWCNKVLEDWKREKRSDWEVQQKLVAVDGEMSVDTPFKNVKNVANLGVKGKEAHRKKDKSNENLPPSFDMVLGTPDLSSAKHPNPPLSPSKRRGGASHYSDIESSPSKKRASGPPKGFLLPEERVPLFGDHTNSRPSETVDLSMEFVGDEFDQAPAPPPKPTRQKSVRTQRSLAALPVEKAKTRQRAATIGRKRGIMLT